MLNGANLAALIRADGSAYAPVHLAATGSWGSNITLSWQHRTRV